MRKRAILESYYIAVRHELKERRHVANLSRLPIVSERGNSSRGARDDALGGGTSERKHVRARFLAAYLFCAIMCTLLASRDGGGRDA